MSKRKDFYSVDHRSDKASDRQDENKIRETLNQEFDLPDVVDRAKSDAFERIRAQAETGKKIRNY